MTIQELANICIALHVYSPDTEDTMRRVARLFEERSGVSNVEDIDVSALLKFKTKTLAIAKPVTFNGYLRYLKVMGNFAVDENLLEENPFKKQKPAPKTKAAYKVVEEALFIEAIRYLNDNPNQFKPVWFWKAVMRTLYYTGIRRRQLVNIQMKDLNFHSKTLKASLLGSKTYREWDIPIHPNLIPELQKLTQESEKALGRKLRSDDHLFAIRRFNQRYAANLDNPDQMKREQVSGFFKRLSGKIEGRIGAHRLRHTTATTLCNPPDGAPDLFAAQDLLGHTELSTTRTYVHTKIDRMRREVGRLPDMKVF